MATGKNLVDILVPKIGSGYVYGGQGQICTMAMINTLMARYGRDHYYFKGYSAEKWIGKPSFDCSGFVSWGRYMLGLNPGHKSYSANGYYTMTTRISKLQLLAGDLCFIVNSDGHATHVGVYMGNGYVVQAASTKSGVIKTKLGTGWSGYGRLKDLVQVVVKPTVEYTEIKFGANGPEVYQMQKALALLNYNPGPLDGVFGPLTLTAVRAFQKGNQLYVDGRPGQQTLSVLYGTADVVPKKAAA